MIDWAHLYGLQADIGGEAFSEVISLFLEEAEGAMARLTEGQEVPLVLHMLKGTAMAVGLTELAARCRDGERRAAAGAMPDVGAIAAAYASSRDGLLTGLRMVGLAPDGRGISQAS